MGNINLNKKHIEVTCIYTGEKKEAIAYCSPTYMQQIYPKIIFTTCEEACICKFGKCDYKSK